VCFIHEDSWIIVFLGFRLLVRSLTKSKWLNFDASVSTAWHHRESWGLDVTKRLLCFSWLISLVRTPSVSLSPLPSCLELSGHLQWSLVSRPFCCHCTSCAILQACSLVGSPCIPTALATRSFEWRAVTSVISVFRVRIPEQLSHCCCKCFRFSPSAGIARASIWHFAGTRPYLKNICMSERSTKTCHSTHWSKSGLRKWQASQPFAEMSILVEWRFNNGVSFKGKQTHGS